MIPDQNYLSYKDGSTLGRGLRGLRTDRHLTLSCTRRAGVLEKEGKPAVESQG